MPLTPYRGPFGYEQAAQLVRRTMFGAPPEQVAALQRRGAPGAVDELLDYSRQELPDNPFVPEEAASPGAAARVTIARWLYEMLHTPYPFREQLTLFWHNHFAIEVRKVRHPQALAGYLGVLRDHGLGSFEKLTLAVATSPAMLRYLDNDRNVKGSPNENFARELLELFTMGIGNYSERDVTEAARALTGWTIRHDPRDESKVIFAFNRRRHDPGIKTVLGSSGRLAGEDVIGLASRHLATASHIAAKLWREFVGDQPDEQGVETLADIFRQSGGDLRAVMRTLLGSEAFYKSRGGIIKSPVRYLVGALRSLSVPRLPERAYFALGEALERLGQLPLQPPNVAGWQGGRAWISDATLLARIDTAKTILLEHNLLPLDGMTPETLGLTMLGTSSNLFAPYLTQLQPHQQAFLIMTSPEYALA